MASAMQALCPVRVQVKPVAARRVRVAAVTRAEAGESRRSVLTGLVAGIAALAAAPAMAKVIVPSQESYGGIGRATGQAKNSTFASMEGYTLEGTKKTGMSVKTQRNVMAAAKKAALEQSTSAAAAPAKKK